jgi:hypothetical protein
MLNQCSLWPLPTTHLWSIAAQRLGHRAMCSTTRSATELIYSRSLLSGILGMSLLYWSWNWKWLGLGFRVGTSQGPRIALLMSTTVERGCTLRWKGGSWRNVNCTWAAWHYLSGYVYFCAIVNWVWWGWRVVIDDLMICLQMSLNLSQKHIMRTFRSMICLQMN